MAKSAHIVLALTLLAACSTGGSRPRPPLVTMDSGAAPADAGGPLDGLVALRLEPESATLRTTVGHPVSQSFRVLGWFEDGVERDVTAHVPLALPDRRVGTVEGAVFRAAGTTGGHTIVYARARGLEAAAPLTVVLVGTFALPPDATEAALPAAPAGLFAGRPEDPALAPTLVYPNDGVILPPNLGRVEVHWLRAGGADLFELTLRSSVLELTFFARCRHPTDARADGCVAELTGDAWDAWSRTARGGDAVALSLRAIEEAGTTLGVAPEVRTVTLAADDLEGSIYYWSTTSSGIHRFDFGAGDTAPEAVLGPDHTSTTERARACVGCHALSRDGRKLMASVGGVDRGGLMLVDLEAGRTVLNRSAHEDRIVQFASFNPDGSELVGVYGDGRRGADLLLFDARCDPAHLASCGSQVGSIPLGPVDSGHPAYDPWSPPNREATHPDWSPDGRHIAFTDVGYIDAASQWPEYATIMAVDFDGTSWSGPRELVAREAGRNRYNPHYAPDASFLVFNESTCRSGTAGRSCNGDSDPSARIFALRDDGTAPVELARATAPGTLDASDELASTFPRFSPFVFELSRDPTAPRRLMWLTFSSTRDYGVRPQRAGTAPESDKMTWLWMAAIEPDRLAEGLDPSHPSFLLPMQDLTSSNHIGVWAERSVGEPPPLY